MHICSNFIQNQFYAFLAFSDTRGKHQSVLEFSGDTDSEFKPVQPGHGTWYLVSQSTVQYLNEEAVLPLVDILTLFDHSKHRLEHLQINSYFSSLIFSSLLGPVTPLI